MILEVRNILQCTLVCTV